MLKSLKIQAFTDPRHNHHPDDQTPRSAKARILKDFNINYTVVCLKFCQLSKETWEMYLIEEKRHSCQCYGNSCFPNRVTISAGSCHCQKDLGSLGWILLNLMSSCLSESRLNLGALTEVSIKYLQELVRFKTNTLSNLNGVAVLRGMEENLSTLSCHKQLVVHWQDFRTRLTSFCI